MTITYADGTVLEAIVFAHEDEGFRVALAGEGDVRTYRRIHGAWLSEECEPLAVEFAWGSDGAAQIPGEVDCLCPWKLASRMISMLQAGARKDDLLDDALYTLSGEGKGVRIHQSRLKVD